MYQLYIRHTIEIDALAVVSPSTSNSNISSNSIIFQIKNP